MVATGNSSICAVGQLQMHPSMGKKYQSVNSGEKRCACKKPLSGCISSPSALRSAMSVARRLKRSTSRSMRQKRGLSRLRRWLNTALSEVPLHSRRCCPALAGTCTENDMSEGAVTTPSSANRAISCG